MLQGLEKVEDGLEAPRRRGLIEFTMREKEIEFLEEQVKKYKRRSQPTSRTEASAQLPALYQMQIDVIGNRK